jgi:hypothetical protein
MSTERRWARCCASAWDEASASSALICVDDAGLI